MGGAGKPAEKTGEVMEGGPDKAAQKDGQMSAELLDGPHLERQTFGDTELAGELLALFEGQCAKLLPLICDDSVEAVTRADAAHTLKGGARAIGAFAVADRAEALELGLRAGDGADDQLLAGLRHVMAATRELIAGRLAG